MSLLSLVNRSTDVLRKLSKSSMDSGSSSAAGGGVAAAVGWGVDAAGGDNIVSFRAGTSFGSSVDVAMSSRREVAASSLV